MSKLEKDLVLSCLTGSGPHWLLAGDISYLPCRASPWGNSQHGSWLPPEEDFERGKEREKVHTVPSKIEATVFL